MFVLITKKIEEITPLEFEEEWTVVQNSDLRIVYFCVCFPGERE